MVGLADDMRAAQSAVEQQKSQWREAWVASYLSLCDSYDSVVSEVAQALNDVSARPDFKGLIRGRGWILQGPRAVGSLIAVYWDGSWKHLYSIRPVQWLIPRHTTLIKHAEGLGEFGIESLETYSLRRFAKS